MTDTEEHHDHSVAWTRPHPDRNYGIDILCCHCDSTTYISIPAAAPAQELAYTCKNCQTIIWLTITDTPRDDTTTAQEGN